MEKELDKKTLRRLYITEKRSIRDIAKMYGCSYFAIRYRCIKYGIKLRPVSSWRIRIDKSVLKRLYAKDNKSSKEIADILSCSSATILKRFKEYSIPLRNQRIKGITKPLLKKFYLKEGKTIREIAEIMGCSGEVIRKRCKQFDIPLRNPGTKKIHMNESTLRKLYVKEGNNLTEIAKILNCSTSVIFQRVKRLGLKKREGR
jgi:DNA-binding CsgD family transcriptional regulator